ncbi:hypothetical protein [Brevibacterium sp. UBA7493]|uniref:hypothetical protein n=1 Tax=Brevibacterium sp. UBA7493 TaxID=1946121 RepID=UPI00257C588B|nr:hypothetical protein [Brevibacterium sp. UBA7493]
MTRLPRNRRRLAAGALALALVSGLSGCTLLGPVEVGTHDAGIIARFTDPRTGTANRSWVIEAVPEKAALRVHAHEEFLGYERVDLPAEVWSEVATAAEAAQERTNFIPEQGCEGAREIEVELWRGDKQMKTLTANNCGSDDTYYDLYIAVTQPLIDEFDPAQLNPNVEPGETQPRTTMSREVSGPPRP